MLSRSCQLLSLLSLPAWLLLLRLLSTAIELQGDSLGAFLCIPWQDAAEARQQKLGSCSQWRACRTQLPLPLPVPAKRRRSAESAPAARKRAKKSRCEAACGIFLLSVNHADVVMELQGAAGS